MNNPNEPIDFVITWVDGNDPAWQETKHKYEAENGLKSSSNRYREWENLKYLFRGIEKFAPWVNKVHFITSGHYPEWLNMDNPKLNFVKHSDYIPEEYLPTFSSHPIEHNIHKIEGLAEHFVYFNDDMFPISELSPTDFFKNGLPTGACGFEVINPAYDFLFYNILRNNVNVICRNFDMTEFVKKNRSKLFSTKYDAKYIKTLFLLPWNRGNLTGFINPHLPAPYKKDTFKKVWDVEAEILSETCSHKFRNAHDVSPYLYTYWQYMTGEFAPINMKKLGSFYYMEKDEGRYSDVIRNHKSKLICLNDDLESDDINTFERLKKKLIEDFEAILPEKSSFEK